MSTTKPIRDSGFVEDFVPPPGPPPPIMPEGWIARFDDRYQRFFYVNLITKQSQWDKPPGTIDAPVSGRASREGDGPPSYDDVGPTSPRPGSGYGQRDEFVTQQPAYSMTPSQPQYPSQQQYQTQPQYLNTPRVTAEPRSPNRGIAGRVSSFLKSHSSKSTPNHQSQQGEQYYSTTQQGYGPQQEYYQQQQSRPVYVQSGGPGYMQGPPQRSGVGGIGTGGAAALGVGGGLLGGMLLADALEDHDDYQQGFEDGADFGGDYGGF